MARRKRRRRGKAGEREHLVEELERLAALAPGGSPERPITVETPPLVDLRAVAEPCPLCEGAMKLEEHAAAEIEGTRLRIATVACASCGVHRQRYFRLAGATLH